MIQEIFAGHKLKSLRQSKGLTQEALAEALGKTSSDVSNYENGFATPPANVLLTMQRFFDVRFSALSDSAEKTYN